MKALFWLAIIAASAFLALFLTQKLTRTTETPMTQKPIEVIAIEHATGIIIWDNTHIYMDPTGGAESFAGQPRANIILVTDIHGDHFSTSTLEATLGDAALIVPQVVKDQLPENLASRAIVLANDQTVSEQGFSITATPMYNLPGSENEKFHTKGRGNGYLIEKDGIRVYIAGDTAGTPEMRALTNIDIAFIPMNLPYTMSVEEAADAVLAFKPKVVYPYHFRGPEGLADVETFKSLVNAGNSEIEVILADWYK